MKYFYFIFCSIDKGLLIYDHKEESYSDGMMNWFLVFNVTFSNISAISWRPVLVVEEAGVPGENHRPWASNW